jgi:hypothetical protein
VGLFREEDTPYSDTVSGKIDDQAATDSIG